MSVIRSGEALTEAAARTKVDELLNAVGSVRDLVDWRDELVRLERLRDGALRGLEGFPVWESLLAAGITRAQDNGALAPDADPDRLATGVMAALRGGLLLARTTRDVGQLETALDMALGYVQAHAVTR